MVENEINKTILLIKLEEILVDLTFPLIYRQGDVYLYTVWTSSVNDFNNDGKCV